MIDTADVFRVEGGGVRWLESAKSLEDAKNRVQELAAQSPGVYLIVDQKTGKEYAIKLDGVAAKAPDIDQGREAI